MDATQTTLTQNETDLAASITAVQQDVTQARTALSAGKAADRAPDVDRAAALLAQAQALAAATPLDVVGATRAATEANTVIDAVLAGIQEADAAVQRNAAAAAAAYANASASVAQANALIGGGQRLGREPTRQDAPVAEAQQYLARAQSLHGHRSRDRGPGIADRGCARRRGDRRDPGEHRRHGRPGRGQLGRPDRRLRLQLRDPVVATHHPRVAAAAWN